MSIVDDSGTKPATPYPFNFSRRDHYLALQAIPTRDLLDEVEAARWLALDVAGDSEPGGSHAVALIQLEALLDEVLRRERLLATHADNPVAPTLPTMDQGLRRRVDAVKGAWPIVAFCTDVLCVNVKPAGRDRFTASCPLPGHDDRSPSFTVYAAEGRAWCFGCNRGGDIIALTGYMFGHERFYDRLEHAERLAAIVGTDTHG